MKMNRIIAVILLMFFLCGTSLMAQKKGGNKGGRKREGKERSEKIASSTNTNQVGMKINKDYKAKANVKIALNAYSFSKVLNNHAQSRDGEQMSLFDLIDFCADNNIPGVDLTGYFFPGYPEVPSDEYIYAVKKHAYKRGVDITGTGIRNNFANPDAAKRKADVEHAKEWIIVASKLGAPVIRVFSGAVPKGYENNWDVPATWITECCKELAKFGEKHGVIVGIQNHGDMLKTADETIKIVKSVNSPWFGVILDTGYFMTDDPYVDMEKVIPYTVNWQVKESPFGKESSVRIDLKRITDMVKKHNYRGYLPIETLSVPNRPYDPYKLVPEFFKEVDAAVKTAGISN